MAARTLAPKTLWKIMRSCAAALCSALLAPGDVVALASANAISSAQAPAQAAAQAPAQADSPKIPPDQLDSLVAPIALYPDALLAQVLAASTYPLEIVQLQQWLEKNKTLKDKALADAAAKQPWDPSVQAMAGLPDVVKRLAGDVQWTTDLGNAFLAQQGDVMDAVQRMRKKAQGSGNLKSSEQQKVETKVVESKQVVVIEQANPQVVYVPSYNPTVVYGPPVYPYPPITYPPPGYYAAGMAISFGVGIAMGAAMGGAWGWGCGWGGGGNNNITINNNNNYNRNSNINGGNRTNVSGGNRVSNQPTRGGAGGGGSWQHNPQHRGGAPYGNRATAQQYGGSARGDTRTNRESSARQGLSQQGDRSQSGSRGQQPGVSNRAGGGADRAGGGAGVGDRASSRGASPSTGARSGGGGGDRIGGGSVSQSSRGGGGGFGGGSGMSGSSARASSSRGSASMGGRGGGGGGRRGR